MGGDERQPQASAFSAGARLSLSWKVVSLEICCGKRCPPMSEKRAVGAFQRLLCRAGRSRRPQGVPGLLLSEGRKDILRARLPFCASRRCLARPDRREGVGISL